MPEASAYALVFLLLPPFHLFLPPVFPSFSLESKPFTFSLVLLVSGHQHFIDLMLKPPIAHLSFQYLPILTFCLGSFGTFYLLWVLSYLVHRHLPVYTSCPEVKPWLLTFTLSLGKHGCSSHWSWPWGLSWFFPFLLVQWLESAIDSDPTQVSCPFTSIHCPNLNLHMHIPILYCLVLFLIFCEI